MNPIQPQPAQQVVQPAVQQVAQPTAQPVAQPAVQPAQQVAQPGVQPGAAGASPATSMGMRVDPSQHERRVARPDRPFPGDLLVRIDGVKMLQSRKRQPYLQLSMTLVAYIAPPSDALPPHLQGVNPQPGTKYSQPYFPDDYYEKDVTTLLCAAYNCEPAALSEAHFDAMIGEAQALRGVFLLSRAWHSYGKKDLDPQTGAVLPGRQGYLNWMPDKAVMDLETIRKYCADDSIFDRIVTQGN